jgi:hypothetical protein
MSSAGLNGALVEVVVAGEGGDGRVTVKTQTVSASAEVARKFAGGLRIKVENVEREGEGGDGGGRNGDGDDV